ncbi:hypothetical protein WN943_001015 [Citrus x changshan-huyou]
MKDNNNQNEYPYLEPEGNEHHPPQCNEFRSPCPRPKVFDHFTLIESVDKVRKLQGNYCKNIFHYRVYNGTGSLKRHINHCQIIYEGINEFNRRMRGGANTPH